MMLMITNALQYILQVVFQENMIPSREGSRSFQDHRVYKVTPTSMQQVELMEAFEDIPEVDFWTPRSSVAEPIEIMVSPAFQTVFEAILSENKIEFKVLIDDVETTVSSERLCQRSAPKLVKGKISFEKYLRYSEIQDYLNHLAEAHSQLVHVENYGASYENRNLTLIRISSGDKTRKKPTIFIDAGIHAREWIAPAQALYIIHQLLENPENRNLIENVNWVVIPLLNPDGYEYAHTDDRFWRKTRSVGKRCQGVDANRNFDFHWLGPGSSGDECSQTYGGPLPFSEPETYALRREIEKHANEIKLYLTLHSAAQCLLYPWGYTYRYPDNVQELHSLGLEVQKAIYAVNGTTYRIGSSSNILSLSSGSSRDWATGVAGIKLSYTVELPGGGDRGFDLPSDRISGVVEEIFEGIKVLHRHIEKIHG